MRESLYKFTAFFHDGQVGGKVGIKHIVEAQTLQGCYHTAGGALPGTQTEFLGPRHPDGRSHLNNRGDFRVSEGTQNSDGIIADCQSTGRTVGDALPAEYAVRVF